MTKQVERLLNTLIEEVRAIREALVKPLPPTEEQLARDLTVVLGTGPDEIFNK